MKKRYKKSLEVTTRKPILFRDAPLTFCAHWHTKITPILWRDDNDDDELKLIHINIDIRFETFYSCYFICTHLTIISFENPDYFERISQMIFFFLYLAIHPIPSSIPFILCFAIHSFDSKLLNKKKHFNNKKKTSFLLLFSSGMQPMAMKTSAKSVAIDFITCESFQINYSHKLVVYS